MRHSPDQRKPAHEAPRQVRQKSVECHPGQSAPTGPQDDAGDEEAAGHCVTVGAAGQDEINHEEGQQGGPKVEVGRDVEKVFDGVFWSFKP